MNRKIKDKTVKIDPTGGQVTIRITPAKTTADHAQIGHAGVSKRESSDSKYPKEPLWVRKVKKTVTYTLPDTAADLIGDVVFVWLKAMAFGEDDSKKTVGVKISLWQDGKKLLSVKDRASISPFKVAVFRFRIKFQQATQ